MADLHILTISAIDIGNQLQRWIQLKMELAISSHEMLAQLLLNVYESCIVNKRSQFHFDIVPSSVKQSSCTSKYVNSNSDTVIESAEFHRVSFPSIPEDNRSVKNGSVQTSELMLPDTFVEGCGYAIDQNACEDTSICRSDEKAVQENKYDVNGLITESSLEKFISKEVKCETISVESNKCNLGDTSDGVHYNTEDENLCNSDNEHTISKCRLCKIVIKNTRLLKKHEQMHFQNNYIVCLLCHTKFEVKYDFIEHMNKFHSGSDLKLSKTNKRLFTCKICLKTFKVISIFRKHQRMCKISTKEFSCTLCKLKFVSKLKWLQHKKSHAPKSGGNLRCEMCNQAYMTEKTLHNHVALHNSDSGFSCLVCDDIKDTKEILLKHVENFHSQKKGVFTCALCGKELRSQKFLDLHRRRQHPQCTKCAQHFNSIKLLEQHEKQCSTIGPQKQTGVDGLQDKTKRMIQCFMCRLKFTDAASKKDHVEFHKLGDRWRCLMCENIYESKLQLIIHVRAAHPIKMLKCSKCDKVFMKKARLEKHEVTHFYSHQCSRCSNKYKSKRCLLEHEKTCELKADNQSTEKYKCPVCGKVLSKKSTLDLHMAMHEGDCPYTCHVCNVGFKTTAQLGKHRRSHNNGQLFCQHCNKQYFSRNSLRRHERMHHGDTPHRCSICHKHFTALSELEKHKLIHIGVKPFVCQYCGISFNRKENLTAHERIHTGNFTHVCKKCSKGFSRKYQLEKHTTICLDIPPVVCEIKTRTSTVKIGHNQANELLYKTISLANNQ